MPRKLFKAGNYSKKETIRGNTVYIILNYLSEGPTIGEVPKMDCSPVKNLDLSEEKMDIVEEKFKESMSGDNRGPNEILAGSESSKDSKMNCNPINEVEIVG